MWPFGGGRGRRARERAAARAPEGPVRTFLATPPPARTTPLAQLPALAVDLETTGLDPERHAIIAVGWIPVDGLAITLGGARRRLVDASHLTPDGVGQSATIHGLTDDAIAAGQPLETVLAELLTALSGRVLIAHHAQIETTFLAAAAQRLWKVNLPVETIDTMVLHQRIVAPGFDDEPMAEDLRLWRARSRFGLPTVGAHDALDDALSCAELYLAQVAELGLDHDTYRVVRS